MATTTSEVVARLYERVRKAAQAAFFSAFLALTPVPASRPRVTKWGGVYYGKPYASLMTEAQAQLARLKDAGVDGPLVLLMEVICTKPPTGKLELPRGDVDNYAKGPMDAITKAATIWTDDTQVGALFVVKRYARRGEPEGIRIEWAPVN